MDKKLLWINDDTHYKLKVMAILKKVTMSIMIKTLIDEQEARDGSAKNV